MTVDLAHTCHQCGAKVEHPANTRWPLCPRCENDPVLRREREYKREARRSQLARVRAWRLGIKGKYYPSDVRRLRRRQKGQCAYCGRELTRDIERVDHIIPISRGGDNTYKNIQLLCEPCNRAKGAKTDAEFKEMFARKPFN